MPVRCGGSRPCWRYRWGNWSCQGRRHGGCDRNGPRLSKLFGDMVMVGVGRRYSDWVCHLSGSSWFAHSGAKIKEFCNGHLKRWNSAIRHQTTSMIGLSFCEQGEPLLHRQRCPPEQPERDRRSAPMKPRIRKQQLTLTMRQRGRVNAGGNRYASLTLTAKSNHQSTKQVIGPSMVPHPGQRPSLMRQRFSSCFKATSLRKSQGVRTEAPALNTRCIFGP